MREKRKTQHDARKRSEKAPVTLTLDGGEPIPGLAAHLIAESPLRSEVAKSTLALGVERMVRSLHWIDKHYSSEATPEERKSIPTLENAVRRSLETLGLVEREEEEEDLL